MLKDAPQAWRNLLVAVLLIAFVQRTIALTEVPPGLHNDDVVEIPVAETFRDGRYGVFFPEKTDHETL